MGIFISYRRVDTLEWAGHLFSDLCNLFGASQVFMDYQDIPSGARFEEVLERALTSCKALLALIGPHWLDCTRDGKRRIDHPDDWVRKEIATSLGREVLVVPVLFGGTPLPSEKELPQELRPLLQRQFAEIHDRRWDADVNALSLDLIEGAALVLTENDLTLAQTGLRQLQDLIETVPSVAHTVGRSKEVIERSGDSMSRQPSQLSANGRRTWTTTSTAKCDRIAASSP